MADNTINAVTLIKSQINNIAKNIVLADGGMEAINFALERIPAAKDEIKTWRAALPYIFAIGMLVCSISEAQGDKTYDEINNAINSVLGAEFIWDKIKHLYPELKDNTDGTANPDGITITKQIIERWEATGAKFSKSKSEQTGETDMPLSPQIKKIFEDNIPILVGIRPDKYISTTDKISRLSFNPAKNQAFYEPDGANVKVGIIERKINGVKIKQPVTTAVSIKFDENNSNIKFSNDAMINPYCRCVHNAIVSLFAAGNDTMTKDMIYRVMRGGTEEGERIHPTEETRREITDAIDLMLHTVITIDASQETKAYGKTDFNFKGHLLPAQICTAKVNGKEVGDCIKLLAVPPLYAYAKRNNQINSCDIELLRILPNNKGGKGTRTRITDRMCIIRDYLLEQILNMKNEKNLKNNIIRYDTLFDYIGLKTPTKKERSDIREAVHQILDTWKSKNLVRDYKELLEGRSISKIEIIF